jgi:hypothetical protein
MSWQRFTVVLAALNVGLVMLVLMQSASAGANTDATIVRAQAWELVDEDGQVRARLNVEESGEVVWRMIDQTGTIRLKMGAGVDGSGLLLLDDETEPGVHLLAQPTGPTVTLTGKDGAALVLQP